MSKRFRDWSPNQIWLFPPSPKDWLPKGHLAYFVLDAVAELDLQPILAHYEKSPQGQPPFDPRMMLTLLFYAYCNGVLSSRKIMQRCETDADFRVIVGEDIPNFRTISDFRKIHLETFQDLFVEVLQLCRESGLGQLGVLALDGTKLKANASRHKAMSYDRMTQVEEILQQEINELLARAAAADAAEDGELGTDRRGDELPAELQQRESRLQKIREAKRRLEKRARAAAQAIADEQAAQGQTPSIDPASVLPEPKDQINFTDPESRIMKLPNKGWDQCGNAQAIVSEDQLIVACDVTDQANDVQQVEPMIQQLEENLQAAGSSLLVRNLTTSVRPALLADAGYYSEKNTQAIESAGLDPFIATQRLRHHERLTAPEPEEDADGNNSYQTPKQKMARKVRSQRGRETYSRRKTIVEPVFGQIKGVRGIRQFSMRGMKQMQGEWALICLTHNLLKLFRAQPA
jgi:transposase